MSTHQLEPSGVVLHVRRWGAPDASRHLLFLHSLGPAASAAYLGLGVEPIVSAGADVAAPDQPGFGESPPLDPDGYAVPRMAELAWALADDLGWDEVVLVGHSWGGSVACHAAASRPDRVRALVLVDSGHLDYAEAPGADLDATLEELIEQTEAARLRVSGGRDAVAEALEVPPDDVLVDAFLEGLVDDGAGGLISRTTGAARGAALYHLTRARQSETWPAIAEARIPTLLLLATVPAETLELNQDGAARFSAVLPDATVRIVDGASHSLITDERERFGEMVAAWLEQVRPARSG
jgi:pimeloyl-ACP methyl ester carboxylesterase